MTGALVLTPLISDRLTARPPDRPFSPDRLFSPDRPFSPDRLSPPDRQLPDLPVHGYQPGLQLYTLRDMLARDTEGTLKALAQIGYREIETHSTYGKTPAEFRAILDRVKLKAPAGHYGVPEVTTGIDQTIATAKVLGHKFVILPWLDNDARSAEGYVRAAKMMNSAGEKLRSAGLTFAYHNHDFEFQKVDGSRTGYDILLAETDPKLVSFELDLFWIRKGGVESIPLMRAHKGRFRLVHVKDMAADGKMVDVGDGVMDWGALLKAAKDAGVTEYFVEHDEVTDGLAFSKKAFETIRRL